MGEFSTEYKIVFFVIFSTFDTISENPPTFE